MSVAAPPSAVLDTNVLLDWLVFRDPRVAPLAAAIDAGALCWLATAAMRREFAQMLGHGCLARWLPLPDQALAVFDLRSVACAEPAPSRLRCTDADDQVFIDLALERRCAWLITHDRALLKLAARARQHKLRVLTPQAWAPAFAAGTALL